MNSEITYQIQRIKKKLLLAKEIDKDLEVFGADSHKYVVGETADADEIFEFEKKYNISLPDCYRAFLLHIGMAVYHMKTLQLVLVMEYFPLLKMLMNLFILIQRIV